MKVLLLGATGLLGHNVLRALIREGHDVHVLVRKHSVLTFVDNPKIKTFLGSFIEEEDLIKVACGCQAIINCAGATDMSLLNVQEFLPANRDGVDTICRTMDRLGIKTLVHTSTANTIGYGSLNHLATEKDPWDSPFKESYYAQSKREGEVVVERYVHEHPDWHCIVINPGFMLGPFDFKPSSGQLLNAAYRRPIMVAPKGGKSFICVEDVAQAIVNALTKGQHGQRYLLTGANISLRDFYSLQASVCNYSQRIISLPNWILAIGGRIGDVLRFFRIRTQLSTRNVRQLMVKEYYDNSKAVQELQLHQTPVAQAIKSYFDPTWREFHKV